MPRAKDGGSDGGTSCASAGHLAPASCPIERAQLAIRLERPLIHEDLRAFLDHGSILRLSHRAGHELLLPVRALGPEALRILAVVGVIAGEDGTTETFADAYDEQGARCSSARRLGDGTLQHERRPERGTALG
ncbi:MAG: hypothetical protein OXT09_33175 [Myxococcales bacterium]|nr:hypothetical protein [Myxococcales bacterium]